MKRKAWLICIAALALLALSAAIMLAAGGYRFGVPVAASAPAAGAPAGAALIERGAYLARAADCGACHTARGGAAFAGGRAIATPFGEIVSPNITPDRQNGLGSWTAQDFWNALHHGTAKDGRLLYPAFPYPNYTLMTRADSDALFAYLASVPPVAQPSQPHRLRFPYDSQLALAAWRALFFRPGAFVADPARSAAWNRGAYLVQGPGHCNACHASRNAFGASEPHAGLAGGPIPVLDWYAPALDSNAETGLGNWSAGEIATLLRSGVSMRAAVFGPMGEVVRESLQHLTPADALAMAEYLKSLPPGTAPDIRRAGVAPRDAAQVHARGAELYRTRCADCHGADGKGRPPAYPPLAGNRAITMGAALNPIRIVLNGGFAPGTHANPRPYGMPPFGFELDDADVAAVVSYIRTEWGNDSRSGAAAWVTPAEVNRYRAVPLD